MSRKKLDINLTNEEREAISRYIQLSEKFKTSYFWESPKSASSRRKLEYDNKLGFLSNQLHLSFSINVSCNHIYITKFAKINNTFCNCLKLKNLLK